MHPDIDPNKKFITSFFQCCEQTPKDESGQEKFVSDLHALVHNNLGKIKNSLYNSQNRNKLVNLSQRIKQEFPSVIHKK